MRVLFISNLYPPAHLGGKEIRCSEVVNGLRARGHACQVLTSTFMPAGTTLPVDPHVKRVLALEADLLHYRPIDHLLHYHSRLQESLRAVDTAIAAFDPDLIFVWGMWNMSPALVAEGEKQLPDRVVYSFGDYWPAEPDSHEQYWRSQNGSWRGKLLCRALGPLALSRYYRPIRARALALAHAVTCSRFVLNRLRAAGLILPHAKVVLSGIDLDRFVPASVERPNRLCELKVIYAGGLDARKGVPVAIEAIHKLTQLEGQQIELTLAGEGHPDRRAHLEELIACAGLGDRVHFRRAVPRREMPQLLQQFDALVLPSGNNVPEPLARVVMEAMACGLVVIATDCGGTPEMIEHGVDGLLFAPGDSKALAEHLYAVATDLDLRGRLAAAARQTAQARFDINRMIDEMESFLLEVFDRSREAALTT